MKVHSGDVVFVRFADESVGSEQHGMRPAVVVSNNVGNNHSTTVIVVPITSAPKTNLLPTHVAIPAGVAGLYKDSTILCENMAHISKERVVKYLGKMPIHFMKKIAIASTLATSLISYLDENDLMQLHTRAIGLNHLKEEN